jgi:hypothetical protein
MEAASTFRAFGGTAADGPDDGGRAEQGSGPGSRDRSVAAQHSSRRRVLHLQPVVDGGACPWQLNCEGCDKFVISGADLLYWRRKREQWASIAERAPDDATADYLHQVFAPTAKAIDGLERALAALGLLDDALALDLRRPQDYFNRIWATAFRATDLANLDEDREATA